MKSLLAIGLSHRTAPVTVREALARTLQEHYPQTVLDETVWLSTCNRLEVYARHRNTEEASIEVRRLLSQAANQDVSKYLYEHRGAEAARHLFRVASSLDSMVLGEPQILGQVKEAFARAQQGGTVGMVLGRTCERALSAAKRVRSETTIARGAVSVGSLACELARKVFGDLRRRGVLLIGAGEMGEAAARYLAEQQAEITVLNRSLERAQRVAETCRGQAATLHALDAHLVSADVVISSTASPQVLITREKVRPLLRQRRHRPLFIIDIALPRDVEPEVETLDNVFLYHLDDLQKLIESREESRATQATFAETIIEEELRAFSEWSDSLALTETIVALRSRFQHHVRLELEQQRIPAPVDLDQISKRITNKLLHVPLMHLKRSRSDAQRAHLVEMLEQLFELRERKEPSGAADDQQAEHEVQAKLGAGS